MGDPARLRFNQAVPASALWPIAVLTLAILAAIAVFTVTETHVEALRQLRAAPRATLANPRSGPAVYRGTLTGPPARINASGQPAAATWWWVVERVSKKSTKTVCFGHDLGGVRLEDGGASLSLALFEGKPDHSLQGDGRTDDWSRSMLVDLGPTHAVKYTAIPDVAAHCRGGSRSFVTLALPPGARVEVLACHRDGALWPCPGQAVTALLAVPSVQAHAERRAISASVPFLFLGIGSLVLFGLLARRTARFRAATFGPLSPEKPVPPKPTRKQQRQEEQRKKEQRERQRLDEKKMQKLEQKRRRREREKQRP